MQLSPNVFLQDWTDHQRAAFLSLTFRSTVAIIEGIHTLGKFGSITFLCVSSQSSEPDEPTVPCKRITLPRVGRIVSSAP